jgi:hypothetical protein
MNSTPISFEGQAIFRDGTLRVEGRARYPNDFTTATLEPFCGPDLIGPVVYFSREAGLARVEVIRVYVTPERYEDIRVETVSRLPPERSFTGLALSHLAWPSSPGSHSGPPRPSRAL